MRDRSEAYPRALGLLALILALLLTLLLAPPLAGAASSQFAAPAQGQAAPLNPDFVLWQAMRGLDGALRSVDGHGLGARPGPQALFTGSVPSSPRAALGYAAKYDLRDTGKLTSVKDQGDWGACWSFATMGSMESCLLPGESRDFSEDNMVLASGFYTGSTPAQKYEAGGHIWMSTAYLARWGGPVWESEDAYGDSYTPGGLSARKHVQDVSWYAQRSSATDNDRIKDALTTRGAAYITISMQGGSSGSSYYNPTTHAYYYSGDQKLNHAVLVVGWDDNYAASNFATPPPGNGAFIVRNSWGTGWGESGFFYVSYYDSVFGRTSYAATVEGAQVVTNYDGVYEYDPLGDVNVWGGSSTTLWGANRFTAVADSTLKAVGFYAEAPNTAYEVWQGPSTTSLSKVTQGTLPQMGFHTVSLPTGPTLTSGAAFVVAVKLTTPGNDYPLAIEYPLAGYSSAATASPGQSYVSSNGTSWTDLTTQLANANVCLKVYSGSSGPGPGDDSEAPDTSAHGYDALWHKQPVRVSFSAVDRGDPPSGVAYTEYSVNSGGWTRGASVLVSTSGVFTISYRSADNAGNLESEHSCVVKVDTVGPWVTARSASVRRGSLAKVNFAVADNVSPIIRFTAKIETRSGVVKKSISSSGWVEANHWWRWTFSCGLTKGSYKICVTALDRAGNKQRSIGTGTLTVK